MRLLVFYNPLAGPIWAVVIDYENLRGRHNLVNSLEQAGQIPTLVKRTDQNQQRFGRIGCQNIYPD